MESVSRRVKLPCSEKDASLIQNFTCRVDKHHQFENLTIIRIHLPFALSFIILTIMTIQIRIAAK